MARKRRTKKQYQELFDNPQALFPGCKVMLWPNGEPEIWIHSARGDMGIAITASVGKAGFGVEIRNFAGGIPMTVGGNLAGDWEGARSQDLARVDITQYGRDDRSQAFKRWYNADSRSKDGVARDENGVEIPYPKENEDAR